MASGSFGPTTAGRMDSYVDEFQAAGGSFVMLAKGNRSKAVTDACKAHGGFYLGSIGGPAARLAQDCITKVEVLEMPELGMEAVWKIEVHDFPAFIVVDDKGNDFFDLVNKPYNAGDTTGTTTRCTFTDAASYVAVLLQPVAQLTYRAAARRGGRRPAANPLPRRRAPRQTRASSADDLRRRTHPSSRIWNRSRLTSNTLLERERPWC